MEFQQRTVRDRLEWVFLLRRHSKKRQQALAISIMDVRADIDPSVKPARGGYTDASIEQGVEPKR
jgi:hypothetical protein